VGIVFKLIKLSKYVQFYSGVLDWILLRQQKIKSKTLLINDPKPTLRVLLLRNPHVLESAQTAENRPTQPGQELSMFPFLYFNGLRGVDIRELLLQPASKVTQIRRPATSNNIMEHIPPDILIALVDRRLDQLLHRHHPLAPERCRVEQDLSTLVRNRRHVQPVTVRQGEPVFLLVFGTFEVWVLLVLVLLLALADSDPTFHLKQPRRVGVVVQADVLLREDPLDQEAVQVVAREVVSLDGVGDGVPLVNWHWGTHPGATVDDQAGCTASGEQRKHALVRYVEVRNVHWLEHHLGELVTGGLGVIGALGLDRDVLWVIRHGCYSGVTLNSL